MSKAPKYVMVTGANGYIGAHVVRTLLENKVRVLALDSDLSFVDMRAEKIACDIFNVPPDVFLRNGIPDVCIHLAWQDGFAHQSDRHMTMLSAHYEFLTTMAQQGVCQIASMGSMHEIGYHVGAVNDETPCRPRSLYGIAKNALRESMMLYCREHGILFQWLRGYYIYGDDIRNHSVFTRILEAAERGENTFPFVTGEKCYDFISIDELSRQLTACVLQTEVGGIINCCSGYAVSLREKAEQFIAEHGLGIRLNFGAFPDRDYDSPSLWGDDTKIRRILSSQRETNGKEYAFQGEKS